MAVIGPPYYALDEEALYRHFAAAAAAAGSLPFYLYEFKARTGYSIPLPVIERLGDRVAGLKVSNQPWEAVEPYLIEGLDVFIGAETLVARGLELGAAGSVSGLAAAFPEGGPEKRAALERFPFHSALKTVLGLRGLPVASRRARAASPADPGGTHRAGAVARIVIAGAGAVGASIAYHLVRHGKDAEVILCDLAEVASGATGKAMGGVRQQFSTAPEVRLAQASAGFFAGLGAPLFEQVGYLFLATTENGGAQLAERRRLQVELGVTVEEVDPSFVRGLRTDDVLGASICREDGVADPTAVTRHLVREAVAGGTELREHTDARELAADVLVVACGAASPELADVPVRPLVRQLVDTEPVPELPVDLPMTIEEETGFHFRRVGAGLRLAMAEPSFRWGTQEVVDETLVADWLERLAYRFPPAAGVGVARAWAGLYDMTPDAHPIIGWVGDGVYAACGFSGHGFMQAPAVGAAVADELLTGSSSFDLSSFRLERFADGAVFPESLVL